MRHCRIFERTARHSPGPETFAEKGSVAGPYLTDRTLLQPEAPTLWQLRMDTLHTVVMTHRPHEPRSAPCKDVQRFRQGLVARIGQTVLPFLNGEEFNPLCGLQLSDVAAHSLPGAVQLFDRMAQVQRGGERHERADHLVKQPERFDLFSAVRRDDRVGTGRGDNLVHSQQW